MPEKPVLNPGANRVFLFTFLSSVPVVMTLFNRRVLMVIVSLMGWTDTEQIKRGEVLRILVSGETEPWCGA